MDNEIINRIDEIIQNYRELEDIDISHESLGTANGFHEAENSKNETTEYILSTLDQVKQNISEVDVILVEESLVNASNIFSKLSSVVKEIDKLVQQGVHNPDYPQQRERLIKQINDFGRNLRKSNIQLGQDLRIATLKKENASPDEIQKKLEEINQYFNEVKSVASESKKILGNLQNRSMSYGVAESVSGFGVLMSNHKKQERVWLFLFIVASIFTVIAFINAINTEIDLSNSFRSSVLFVKHIMLIAVPALFMKVSMAKYNLERNLRIIYSHRESVLDQYKNFENAIGDDNDAKNEFRLELAKYIFSDPQTGYAGKIAASSDLNVNPVLNMVEKAIK